MSPVARAGVVAPAVVAALTLIVWGALGAGWALATLAAGAAAVIAFHVWHLDKLAHWARGPQDAVVPDGRGMWADVFSALYRRTRVLKAYQRDLRAQIERFRTAAEAIPDGIVIVDELNRIEWANPRACEQLGLDLRTDSGQPIVNLIRQPEFLRYLERGDFGEALIVDNGREPRRMLSLQLVPYGVEEKLLMSHDVTQIEAVARMRRDFIANVSHELKTPLTVVAGFLETLQDIELDAPQRERCVSLMHGQARNMQRLVDDLLTLSALESEQSPFAEAPAPIGPLLAELAAQARALSRGRHTIVLDAPSPDDAASVVCARDELASAFGNLVSNAIRYTPDGGKVTLTWRIDPDGGARFTVGDTGIGIAAEHLPRLTERFYRVDRSRSRATGGTGLGLAIVKHVLLRHQCELQVASEPGKGSVFTVRIPAARVQAAELERARATSTSVAAGDRA